MRHKRVIVASTVAVAATALVAAPVAAQEELLPISVTPSSGPPGTVFTFSGEGCLGEEPGDVLITVFFTDNEVVDEFDLTAEADGSWAVDFDTGVPEPLPPGVYTVTATCFVSLESEEPEVIADYDFADFELTAPPKPEPPKPPAPEPEPAQPAAPVVEEPDFTG
jgi:hypothetical protein